MLFCLYFNKQSIPASSDTLALYAQFLSRTFKSVQSIQNYLSGVKLIHILTDNPTPQFSAIDLKLAIRGLSRLKPHAPKQALPITPDILLKLASFLDLDQPFIAVFWCMSLFAFFLMARKSNLVPNSTTSFDPNKQLCNQDVFYNSDYLLVRLKWSKTNQFGKRAFNAPIAALPFSPLCPLRAFLNMKRLVPGGRALDPLFSLSNRGKNAVPFTYPQMQSTLKQCITVLGLDPSAFSSHSFRRGGATTAFRAKVPPELIQLQGDWLSDAYKNYLQFDLKDRAIVSTRMAEFIASY